MYPLVLACVSVCGCLSAEAKAKTIGHLIGSDFTLYLLALACDNRLARKSDGNKERPGAEKKAKLQSFCCCVGVNSFCFTCVRVLRMSCVCVGDRKCRCVCLSMSDDLAHFNLWQGEDVVKTIITFFLSLITAH